MIKTITPNKKINASRTIFHIELKHFDAPNSHHYFGSKAAAAEDLGNKLGISYGKLRTITSYPYENDHCIIRYGILLSKAGGRGRR